MSFYLPWCYNLGIILEDVLMPSKQVNSVLRLSGKVVKNLSNGFYQVLLSNKKMIIACVSGKMRKYSVRILINDDVDVDISVYDLTRGRIVARK